MLSRIIVYLTQIPETTVNDRQAYYLLDKFLYELVFNYPFDAVWATGYDYYNKMMHRMELADPVLA